MDQSEDWTHPFTAKVRFALVGVAIVLLAVGATSVFLTDNAGGAAALITLGTGVGVLALVGPYVDAFSVGGVEATFKRKAAAGALQDAIESTGIGVSSSDKSGALRRAEAHLSLLRKAVVLWVDDDPGGNDSERRMLTSLGVNVDIALNNNEAISKVQRRRYDCVISDIDRPEGHPSGLELTAAVQREAYRWLVFYVGRLDKEKGTPAYALGITNRPDQLLHYVLDAVEREGFERVGKVRH